MQNVKVGDTVWIHDANRRKYDENRRTIKSYHYVAVEVTGETSRSWLVKYRGTEHKISKKDGTLGGAAFGLSARVWFSQREVDDAMWIDDNRHKVAEAVGRCQDADMLRAIAVMLKQED